MKRSDFDYLLPQSRIAQTPLTDRDQSRLLVLDKAAQTLSHRFFYQLPEFFQAGDVLVLNDTRVIAQRLFGARPGHPEEQIETFLIVRVADGLWQALVRPGKKLPPGTEIVYSERLSAQVLDRTEERGGRLLQFEAQGAEAVEDVIAAHAEAPLPPYITEALPPERRDRYQTVYARHDGSAAAPTAGLHFTPRLLAEIEERGVQIARVTLHVGTGTFRPIETEDVGAHTMHAERIEVTEEAAEQVNAARGRVIAIGTTSVRALESAAIGPKRLAPMSGETAKFILPGYQFQIVDALVTNFHMPRSTLLLLVSALAGTDLIRRAYAEALAQEYRFLSFGDAMLIH